MQRTLIDRCCLSQESHWVVNVWMTQPVAKHLEFRSAPFISVGVVCSSINPLRLKVEASPSSTLNPEQRFWEIATKKKKKRTKNIQFQIFQYYMITFRFPLFQSDQSVDQCNSICLLSLTEESYSAKTLAAWVNNSVLAGADKLCGSSVFPHLHRSATSPQRIHYMCFGDERGVLVVVGENIGDTSACYCYSLLCLLDFNST